MKLLIVDDHAGVRAMIREIADLADHDVRESSTGEGALAVLRDFLPDVITMDAQMPGLGGIETTRRVHALYPNTRVVVVSAHDFPAMRAAALDAGAHEFVAKDDLCRLRVLLARWRTPRVESAPDATASELSVPEN
jgi:DNA-binding NarL/FixJ family response regulator